MVINPGKKNVPPQPTPGFFVCFYQSRFTRARSRQSTVKQFPRHPALGSVYIKHCIIIISSAAGPDRSRDSLSSFCHPCNPRWTSAETRESSGTHHASGKRLRWSELKFQEPRTARVTLVKLNRVQSPIRVS